MFFRFVSIRLPFPLPYFYYSISINLYYNPVPSIDTFFCVPNPNALELQKALDFNEKIRINNKCSSHIVMVLKAGHLDPPTTLFHTHSGRQIPLIPFLPPLHCQCPCTSCTSSEGNVQGLTLSQRSLRCRLRGGTSAHSARLILPTKSSSAQVMKAVMFRKWLALGKSSRTDRRSNLS